MPDDVEELPDRLKYLEPVLRKFTLPHPDAVIDDAEERADDLDTDALQELAAAYREIVRRDDVHALSAWAKADEARFHRQWEEWCKLNDDREARGEARLPGDQSPAVERGLQLFYMFDRLAKRKLPPFATREVVYSPPPVVLDWTKLPVGLRYVSEPAMKYRLLWNHDNRARFRRRLTAADHDELEALAKRVRSTCDFDRLSEWLRQHPHREHPETYLVMTLAEVLAEIVPW
jgi:hypothetical protein